MDSLCPSIDLATNGLRFGTTARGKTNSVNTDNALAVRRIHVAGDR